MKKLIFILTLLISGTVFSQNLTYVEGIAYKTYTTAQLNALPSKVEGDAYYDSTVKAIVFWDGTQFKTSSGSASNLQLVGNVLSLTNPLTPGNEISLSPYLDNTDNQSISLVGNTLTLEDGGTVDLSSYLDNKNVASASLVGNNLTLTLSDASTVVVDISGIDTTYTAGDGVNLTGTEFSADSTRIALIDPLSPDKPRLWFGTKAEADLLAAPPTGVTRYKIIKDGDISTDYYVTGLQITGTSTKTVTVNRSGGLPPLTATFNDIDSGGVSDGNDFPTGGSVTGSNLTLTIPNQIDPVIDISGIDAGSLNGQLPSYYLDFTNFTNISVGTTEIQDNAITTNKIANSTIQSIDILDGTIGVSDIANGAVNGDKILDGGVLLADLANNSVNSSKIVDGTITSSDLSSTFYSTGSFTPTAIDGPEGLGGATYTTGGTAYGKWVRIGDQVTVSITLAITSTSGTPGGLLYVTGLPFTISGGNGQFTVTMTNSSVNFYSIVGVLADGAGPTAAGIGFKIQTSLDGGNFDNLDSVTLTGSTIRINGTYIIN